MNEVEPVKRRNIDTQIVVETASEDNHQIINALNWWRLSVIER